MPDHVTFEVEDGVGTIRLDRPPVNALDAAMQDAVAAVAAEATARPDVAAVVIYGGPRAFAAGADIKEMAAMSHADMVERSRVLQADFAAVAAIPKPVIAAVTGYALGGGCELALCADFRVVAQDARLGQPEIQLGIIPGAGGTQRLSRLVGPARAKDLIFSGRHVDAAEAARIGLADRVVPADAVYPTALEWARTFVGGPALALRAAKEAIDHGLAASLPVGLEIERAAFASLFATQDRAVGMASFLEQGPGKARFVGH